MAPPQTPLGGVNSAPPDPVAGLRGHTSKGRGGEGGGKVGGEGKGGGERRGAGEKGREGRPPNVRDALTPLYKTLLSAHV